MSGSGVNYGPNWLLPPPLMYSYPVQLLGRLFLKTLLSSSHKSKVETLPNRKVEMKTILGATKQQLLLLSELPLVGGRLIEKHQSANNKQLKGSVQRHMAVSVI